MTEAELDRLRRELPPLVGRIVRSTAALLSALDDPVRAKSIGCPAQVLAVRGAMGDFENWLTRAGGRDLLAEALLPVVEVGRD